MQISSSGAHLQAMNNTNASNLPAGVNISSLSLAKSPNVRLHNLVSLTNMQGATQCIALPISLMMSPVSASSSTVTVQSASGAGTIASSAASLLTTSTNSNGIVLGTLDDKKATLDSSACGSTLINSHTNSVTLSTGHSSVHPSPTLPPPVGQTVLLIENSNGNEMQLLQPSTGSSNLLHNNSTGQVVTSQLNNANLLSAINVSTGMNLHQSLSTTSGHSISLLSNASTKPATISSRTTSALSTSAHLLGSLQAGPLSADYAKGLISKQPNKFTGSGQLQIQLGGKSISAEPNATTIQLTSGTRVHLPKSSHLPTQLLLQPSSGSASVTSSQLISRKMNHK